MKTPLSALLLATALLPAALPFSAGAARPATAAPAVVSNGQSSERTTKSTFAAAGADHNPFWPIGWVKTEETTASNVSTTIPHATDFTVSTILLNDPPLAMINGKEMAEGEVASLMINGAPVTVQLMAVQDGRVVLRWQNQAFTVPLHRDEILSKGDAVAGQTAQR